MGNPPYVDLHVHSCYSDGSMSPDEIVAAAVKNEVGVLAIADHDIIEGSLLLRDLCRRKGIAYLPAVELDALEDQTNFHILAYGFRTEDREFIQFIGHLRFLLEESGVKLVEACSMNFPHLSLTDYMDFDYDKHLGGWKALHYLMARGITSSLKEGISYYPKYHVTYDKSGYSSISSICYRIKQAGGYAVLAHPRGNYPCIGHFLLYR